MINPSDFLKWLNVFGVLTTNSPIVGGVTPLQVQRSAFNHGADSGIADAYVVTLTPTVTAYTDGLAVSFTPNATNTTTMPTIQINSLSAVPLYRPGNLPMVAGDILFTSIAYAIYSAAAGGFIVLNPVILASGGVTSEQVQQAAYNTGLDTGTANAYILDLTPAVSSGTDGLPITLLQAAFNNTGASTITLNGNEFGIVNLQFQALTGGEIQAGSDYNFILNQPNGVFVLLNSSLTGTVIPSQVQQASFNHGIDTGTANDYIVDLSPAITGLTPGLMVSFQPVHNNTGASTITINGFGPVDIRLGAATILNAGNITTQVDALLIYNSNTGFFNLINPILPASVTAVEVQQAAFNNGSDLGNADQYDVLSNVLQVASYTDGLQISFTAANTNLTTTPTIQVDSNAVVPIYRPGNLPMAPGDILATSISYMMYSSAIGGFIMLNPSNGSATPWTPTITFGVPGDLSVSYMSSYGSYTQNGNIITLTFNIDFTPTYTTASGSIFITAVPVLPTTIAGRLQHGIFANMNALPYPTGVTQTAIEIGSLGISIIGTGTAINLTPFETTQFLSGVTHSIQGTITYSI